MRYKLQSLWLLLVVILGSVSCAKSNDLDEPKLEKKAFLSTEFSTKLSDEEAIKQAQSLYSIIGAKDGFRSVSRPRVKNVLRSKNSDNLRAGTKEDNSEAGFVVVNFENDKGFVLLSDDKLSEPLLGFSDKGYLDLNQEQNPTLNVILNAEQDYLHSDDHRRRKKRCSKCGSLIIYSNKPATIMKMSELGCSEEICAAEERRRAKEEEEEYERKEREKRMPIFEYGAFKPVLHIAPLVPVEWKQRKPHNTKLDKILDKRDGKMKLPPVGCVATAVSQIMSYHRYPTYRWGKTIDWDRLINDTYSPYSVDILATLHRELGYPQFLHMNYGLDGSGAPSENVPRTFRAYGYKCSDLIDYDFASIKDEIISKRPVYMRGRTANSGHAWVLDGWVTLQRLVTVRRKDTKEVLYCYNEKLDFVHCNVGWGPYYNGYYFSKAFTFQGDRAILEDNLTIKKGRDVKTDILNSSFDRSFNIVKNISR